MRMSLPKLNTFLRNTSLKFGAYCIGWAEIVFCIVWFCVIIFSLVAHDKFVGPKYENVIIIGTHIFILICSILCFASAIFLLISINESYVDIMRHWVTMSIWILVLIYFKSLADLVFTFIAGEIFDGLFFLVFYLISIAIFVYCIIIISSYRKELEESKTAKEYTPPKKSVTQPKSPVTPRKLPVTQPKPPVTQPKRSSTQSKRSSTPPKRSSTSPVPPMTPPRTCGRRV